MYYHVYPYSRIKKTMKLVSCYSYNLTVEKYMISIYFSRYYLRNKIHKKDHRIIRANSAMYYDNSTFSHMKIIGAEIIVFNKIRQIDMGYYDINHRFVQNTLKYIAKNKLQTNYEDQLFILKSFERGEDTINKVKYKFRIKRKWIKLSPCRKVTSYHIVRGDKIK